MPSKIQVDENLVFLYQCLVHSDCKTIDFNAVGAATNLRAPAARMRYSRLKKYIETKLVESSKKGQVVSAKAATASNPTLAAKKVQPGTRLYKKRKLSYESEDEAASVDDEIGNVTIQDDRLRKGTSGPITRDKKMDLKEALVSNSNSFNSPGLGNRNHGSSDDYEMEDITEDEEEEEEEFHADEAEEDEDDRPVSTRQKSRSQPASRKTSNAKSVMTTFKKSSNAVPCSVPDSYANETVLKSGVPVTPEPGLPSGIEIKGESLTLPPTPQSMPTDAIKQEPANSAGSKVHPDVPRMSRAARSKKVKNASPLPSLFDRVEAARIQADFNLASLSHRAYKSYHSPNDNQNANNETILPSIEHDDEEDDKDATLMNESGRSSARSSSRASGTDEGRTEVSEYSYHSARTDRSKSSVTSSPVTIESVPHSSAAPVADPPIAQALAGNRNECLVQ